MTEVPAPPDVRDRPRVGVDEWVASQERLDERYSGFAGRLLKVADRMPWYGWLALGIAAASLVGGATSDEYVLRVGTLTILFVALALGLNIVVGWAGLLDLGYIVFMGLGAYGFAWFSSDQFHTHWPAELSVPIVIAGTAVVGLLIGLTSWRLQGDYLAIVTLFMLEIFGNLTVNVDRIKWPGFGHLALTNGPNGILSIDSYNVFGLKIAGIRGYYFLALVAFAIVAVALWFLNESRTGRAWRALREDPLAAELLSIPVKWLKLLAFVLGAAVAAFVGTIYAGLNGSVFPSNFLPEFLILLYAMVILGGTGSIGGVAIGAVVINVGTELLRSPSYEGYLFYGLIAVGLLSAGLLRRWPWRWVGAVTGGAVAFGLVVHAIVGAVWDGGTGGHVGSGGWVGSAVRHWVLLPKDPYYSSRYAYVLLVLLAIAAMRAPGLWRKLLLVPTLYLAACVWENLLTGNPAGTRLILLGSLLVVLMNVRPQGLLGTARVEIV